MRIPLVADAPETREGSSLPNRRGGGSPTTGEPDVPDGDLVLSVANGIESGLAGLYDRYGRRAYSLARRICADDGLAEDVVQEVFLTFWRAPHRFDPDRGSFGTWILTLVHHKSVDTVRRESTIRRRTVPAAEEGQEWSAPPGPGADHGALRSVEAGQVRTALGGLPTDQRQALALAYFGGYTQREVAAMTGVPLGTVKSRMFSGMQRLRKVLAPVLDRGSDNAGNTGDAR